MRYLPLILVLAQAVLAQAPPPPPLLYTLTSPNLDEDRAFGGPVTVGDLDSDGFTDFLAVAVHGSSGTRRVHAFSGQSGDLLFTLQDPDADEDSLWGTVGAAGDLDADGVPDLLVGATGENDGVGHAYAFSGASLEPLLVLAGPSDAQRFGAPLTGVGDVSGDGVPDLLVGAPRTDYTFDEEYRQDAGRAYLFSGATGSLLQRFQSPAPTRLGWFGWDLDGPGDLNADGVPDLLISAPYDDSALDEDDGVGVIYAFSGASGALLYASTTDDVFSAFGYALAVVGDLTGDGVSEVLVGAPFVTPGDDGRAYVLNGQNGEFLHELQSPNPEPLGLFGDAVAAAGDLDEDGLVDLLVGARQEDVGVVNAGRAYAFSGATGEALLVLESPAPNEGGYFGAEVAGLGDLSGDGVSDIGIGAPREDVGGYEDAGRIYVFGGAPVASEEAPAPAAGFSVSAHPNPARATAAVTLTLEEPSDVAVTVHDVLGREVLRLHGGALAAGAHRLPVETAALAPGLYLVRAATPTATATARLLVLR